MLTIHTGSTKRKYVLLKTDEAKLYIEVEGSYDTPEEARDAMLEAFEERVHQSLVDDFPDDCKALVSWEHGMCGFGESDAWIWGDVATCGYGVGWQILEVVSD